MEQKRLDLYTFSEHQLILLNTCINAWRGSTFWALMYMQSRLFHAENVDSIYRELQAQPAQYDQIMERYYGIQLITGTAAAGSPLYRYYAAYLDALDARQRSQAERIRCQWLDLNRLTAARLSALNPHWDAVYGAACLSTIPPCSAMPPTRICWAITTPSARPTCCWTSSPARWAST